MWEFIQGYGIWILLAMTAFRLLAGGCSRGSGMGCGGHVSHRRRRDERRSVQREPEDERDEATLGSSRHGQPHH
jgi:hypothetical protein